MELNGIVSKAKSVVLLSALSFASAFAAWDGSKTEPAEQAEKDGVFYYTVTTPSELAWVAAEVNSNEYFRKMHVTLANDLIFGGDSTSISENNWTPIGNDEHPFYGEFDGAGHTIYGLLSTQTKRAGLFGDVQVSSTHIHDLTLKNGQIAVSGAEGSAGSVAALIGSGATISNCQNYNKVMGSLEAQVVGGIVGKNIDSRVIKSLNEGLISFTSKVETGYVGGIAGKASGSIIENENRGKIYVSSPAEKPNLYVGGIVGIVSSSPYLINNKNSGEISANLMANKRFSDQFEFYVGGIVGKSSSITGTAEFNVNEGPVKATIRGTAAESAFSSITSVGGLFGSFRTNPKYSVNKGKVEVKYYSSTATTAKQFLYVGGVAGTLFRGSNLANHGDISVDVSLDDVIIYAGGVAGNLSGDRDRNDSTKIAENHGNINITNSTSSSISNVQAYVGGVLGLLSNTDVNDVYNLGNLTSSIPTANSNAGGIVGELKSSNLTNGYSASPNIKGFGTMGGVAVKNWAGSKILNCRYDISLISSIEEAVVSTEDSATTADVNGYQTHNIKSDAFAYNLNTTSYTSDNSGIWGRDGGYPVFANDSSIYPIYRIVGQTVTGNHSVYVSGFVDSLPIEVETYEDSIFVGWVRNIKSADPFYPQIIRSNNVYKTKYASKSEPLYMVTFFDEEGTGMAAAITDKEGKVSAFPEVTVPADKILVWKDAEGIEQTVDSTFTKNTNLTMSLKDVPPSSSSEEQVTSSSSEEQVASSSSKEQVKSSSSKGEVSSSSSSKKKSSSSTATIAAIAAQKNFSVAVEGRTIAVAGFSADIFNRSIVSVMDMQGRVVVAPRLMAANGIRLEVPRAGSYIIRINNQSTRVVVK